MDVSIIDIDLTPDERLMLRLRKAILTTLAGYCLHDSGSGMPYSELRQAVEYAAYSEGLESGDTTLVLALKHLERDEVIESHVGHWAKGSVGYSLTGSAYKLAMALSYDVDDPFYRYAPPPGSNPKPVPFVPCPGTHAPYNPYPTTTCDTSEGSDE